MTKSERQLQALATFVHGALASLHALGFVYNIKRGNKLDSIAHATAFLYDMASTKKHYDAIKDD